MVTWFAYCQARRLYYVFNLFVLFWLVGLVWLLKPLIVMVVRAVIRLRRWHK
jgi:hypothetical protein